VTVLDPPTLGRTAQIGLPLAIFLTVVVAVAAGLGVVFVWHLFDDRFVSVRDVKDQFGETVLGLVPRIKIRRSEPKTALLREADPRRAYWESYRHLRSALLLTEMGEHRPQVVMFTGTMAGEGKTTVAVNLARVLARSGLRVALVDVDPHGGGFYEFLGEPGRPGLLDFLRGESTINDIVESSDIPGLDFVGAGTHRDEAEGLLLRPQLAALLEELRKNHDYVILDGAPILAADDAALLVPHADAVVLVMRPFFSHSRLVRQALDMLYQRQAKHVAIVFNQARADDLAGQRYYHSRNGAAKPDKARATSA
jgi:polysaccharide biosynthesis transport protein